MEWLIKAQMKMASVQIDLNLCIDTSTLAVLAFSQYAVFGSCSFIINIMFNLQLSRAKF